MAAGMGAYEWRFDSGRVCLDLVATSEAVCGVPDPLAGAGRLGRWLTGAGLLPAGTPLLDIDDRWTPRFIELRDCVGQLVRAEIDGRYAESALERVNAFAADPPPGIRAVRDDSGSLVRALSAGPECAALIAAVARDAVELLTDPAARARLRQCEGDNCRRVYLDTSRGRRRRWCSSEVCGNRERVARHRRRAAVARA
ncbi:ABATE domain-containing protein [Streptomyces sp. NBC_01142]|uniref:CGNR zinc finger domain-containing protein n=1 Tax=Streptomyces sp. NBC_01142 TaxID=2975865 RepID=UPI0022596355|nr:CGNR zinc finger domain-containing protein [Streptomyces sp. NBC_01142]MCX4823461.1 ABATE domain-containing protein [Streptomyces sp. NBC_01142]